MAECKERECEECGQSFVYSYLEAEKKYSEASNKKKNLCEGCKEKAEGGC
ncbi:MAG: hypothetical protein L6408_08550 [Nanoarchaeota archaeon]|nr:hypothetical protein [Nanoarchaeota archaeon]